jgi:hypothetical protein
VWPSGRSAGKAGSDRWRSAKGNSEFGGGGGGGGGGFGSNFDVGKHGELIVIGVWFDGGQ